MRDGFNRDTTCLRLSVRFGAGGLMGPMSRCFCARCSRIAVLGEGGLCPGCETCTFPNCGFGK